MTFHSLNELQTGSKMVVLFSNFLKTFIYSCVFSQGLDYETNHFPPIASAPSPHIHILAATTESLTWTELLLNDGGRFQCGTEITVYS